VDTYRPAILALVGLALAGPAAGRIVIPGYWFALTAFHPRSKLIQADDLQTVSLQVP